MKYLITSLFMLVTCMNANAKSFGSWRVTCESDKMSDEMLCTIYDVKSKLLFFANKNYNGVFNASVLGHDFPGAYQSIRIDKGKQFSSTDSIANDEARKLLSSIKEGSLIRTRHYEWPHETSVFNKNIVNDNFFKAINYSSKILKVKILTTKNNNKTEATSKGIGVIPHTHANRTHAHKLPSQGVRHSHGDGVLGRYLK